MESEWLTVAEVAEILGITRVHVTRRARNGSLKGEMVPFPGETQPNQWRFRRTDVEDFAVNAFSIGLDMNEWISIEEAARILGIHYGTVVTRADRGLIDSKIMRGAWGKRRFVRRAQCDDQAQQRPVFHRVKPLPTISAAENELAWFAGLFDGEGCVSIYHNGNRMWTLKITAPNSGIEAMYWVKEHIGGDCWSRKAQKPGYREQVIWAASCDTACAILQAIRPFMKIKHLQTDLGIEFQLRLRADKFSASHPMPPEEQEWREAQRLKICALNRPGKLTET